MVVTLYLLLYIISVLPGYDFELYLINGADTVCINEVYVTTNNVLHLNGSTCYPKVMDNNLKFDYDFETGKLYYLTNSEYGTEHQYITCSIIKNNSHCAQTFDTTEVLSNVTDMAWDWIHKSMYVSDRHGQRLAIKDETSLRDLPCNCIRYNAWESYMFGVKAIGTAAGVQTNQVVIQKLHVDPYNRTLFLKLQYDSQIGRNPKPNKKTVILRSDLLARNAKLTPNRIFSSQMEFNVDITEHKIYIWERNVIYKYDYSGNEIGYHTITLFNEPHEFVAFKQLITFTASVDYDRSYILGWHNLTNGNEKWLSVKGARKPFKLYDARSKRKMVNSTYTCDRSDCSDKCEVRPAGDTCVCQPFRAKSIDGKSCYYCGISNLTTVSHQLTIVDGFDATLSDFPWFATIYELGEREWEQKCGGTLISPKFVMTAAHCVINLDNTETQETKDPEKMMVAFGKLYSNWSIVEKTELKMKVKEIRAHSEFLGDAVDYAQDIALIVLVSKVKYNTHVMPACLDFNQNQLPPINNLTAYVPGFGQSKQCDLCSGRAATLQYTSTKRLITFADCVNEAKENIRNSPEPSTHFALTPDKFCIGNGTVSEVQRGDSGGGLTVAHDGIHFVIGVVSSRFLKIDGDSSTYSYGAFSNVTRHMDWLMRQLTEEE